MKTLFFLSLLTSPFLQAGQFDHTRVPGNAEWYLHLDLEQLRETKFGEVVIREISKDHDDKIAHIEGIFKINPLEDLHDITLFGDGKKDHAAVFIKGGMDREYLEKTITQADDYRVKAHGDVVIHTWMDDSGTKRQNAAFHGPDLLIFSDRGDLVRLALDTLAKKKPHFVDDEKTFESQFLHARANIQKLALADDDGSRLLRKVEHLTITLQEDGDRMAAQMFATPKNERHTKHLTNILEGLVSFYMMNNEHVDEATPNINMGSADGEIFMFATLPVEKTLSLLAELTKK